MDQSTQLAGERLRLLLEQLGEEYGHARGWKAEVSRRTGVSASAISHVMHDGRGVGHSTVRQACLRMGLDPLWFFARSLHSRSYRDYLRGNAENLTAVEPAVFREFVEHTSIGRQLAAGEVLDHERSAKLLDQLRRLDLSEIPGIDAGCYEEMARRAVLALMRSPTR